MPNRYICTVLEEMRSCHKTRNYAGLMGLIEEAQSLASRMESVLEDRHDIEKIPREAARLKREMKKLRSERDILADEVAVLKEDKEQEVEQLKKVRHALKKETKGGTISG